MLIINQILCPIISKMMQRRIKQYNYLIMGRSKVGKTSLAYDLTGNQTILSKSKNKVSIDQIKYYRCKSERVRKYKAVINVIDTPSMDKMIDNYSLRESLAKFIENQKIEIAAILYLINVSAQQIMEEQQTLKFVQELPGKNENIKHKIIPVLTFYDAVFDIFYQDPTVKTSNIKTKLFYANHLENLWQKHIIWLNYAKYTSLINKNQHLKQIYQVQAQKLLSTSRQLPPLTYYTTQKSFLFEEKFILQSLPQLFRTSSFQFFSQATSFQIPVQFNVKQSVQKSSISFKDSIKNFFKGTVAFALSGGLMILTPLTMVIGGFIGSGSYFKKGIEGMMNQEKELKSDIINHEGGYHRKEIREYYYLNRVQQRIFEDINKMINKSAISVKKNVFEFKYQLDRSQEYGIIIESMKGYINNQQMEYDKKGKKFTFQFNEKQERVHHKLRLQVVVSVPTEDSLIEMIKKAQDQYSDFNWEGEV